MRRQRPRECALPLEGENAENEVGVESRVESPAGDDTNDDGLVNHDCRGSLRAGEPPVKQDPARLTRAALGRTVHRSMTRTDITAMSITAGARKRVRPR